MPPAITALLRPSRPAQGCRDYAKIEEDEAAWLSGCLLVPRDAVLALATSGGVTEAGPVLRPYVYSGFLAEPVPGALGMLAVAAIARARYFDPSRPAFADPVVTSNVDTLRFESFSGCCGVHARLDLPPGVLDGQPAANGTTNVDFNPPMRAALAVAAATGSPIRPLARRAFRRRVPGNSLSASLGSPSPSAPRSTAASPAKAPFSAGSPAMPMPMQMRTFSPRSCRGTPALIQPVFP